MANLLDLAEAIRLKRDEIEEAGNQLKINITMVMLNDLVQHTPVDVSTAMSNWRVSLGSPAVGIIPAHSPGDYGSTRGESAEATISAGRLVLQGSKPGQNVWISNNIDYIADLDRGTSAQEPAGLFARALAKGRIFLKKHG